MAAITAFSLLASRGAAIYGDHVSRTRERHLSRAHRRRTATAKECAVACFHECDRVFVEPVAVRPAMHHTIAKPTSSPGSVELCQRLSVPAGLASSSVTQVSPGMGIRFYIDRPRAEASLAVPSSANFGILSGTETLGLQKSLPALVLEWSEAEPTQVRSAPRASGSPTLGPEAGEHRSSR
jgi:hypothetical protein